MRSMTGLARNRTNRNTIYKGKLVGYQKEFGFIEKLSIAVVAQARHDLWSRDPEIRKDARDFFASEDALIYCEIAGRKDLLKG